LITLALLAIALAWWAINDADKLRAQNKVKRVKLSIANILALFAIIAAAGAMIHGPVGPEMREVKIRKLLRETHTNLRQISEALKNYKNENSNYPPQFTPHLTTPIKYLENIPLDPFQQPPQDYRYFVDDEKWILASVGPDTIADTSPPSSEDAPDTLIENFQSLKYDPTNGIQSQGDVILVSE
jgi:hypothetical protein